MPRLRHADILIELSELCHEIMNDIRQQLVYYRASVYKDETSRMIKQKIDQLRLVVGLFCDDILKEPFRDHDAMAEAGVMNYIPGECSFSTRVTCLLAALQEPLSEFSRPSVTRFDENQKFTLNVQKYRTELLSICRHGSRQWTFFRSML